MSANDKLAATFGPGRTTPTPTLETQIAEILAQHVPKRPWSDSGVMKCSCGERFVAEYDYQQRALHQAHVASALAPVIAEAQAEALRAFADEVRDFSGDTTARHIEDMARARADKLVTE